MEEAIALKILTRQWLRVRGPDALRFLTGMWTADFKRAVSHSGSATGEALLLNAKGQLICDAVFLVEKDSNGLPTFLFSTNNAAEAFESLNRFLVADDVEVESIDAPFEEVLAVPDSPLKPVPKLLEPGVPTAVDQLFEALGFDWGLRVPRRRLGSRHEEWWVKKKSNLPTPIKAIEDDEYTALRIENGFPEWGVDWNKDALPLEFPVLNSISYFKGCYIGQEVIARATYRGHMNRGFCRFEAEPGASLGPAFIYASADPQKPVGKITTFLKSRGLGLLRLSALDQELFQLTESGEKLAIKKVDSLINRDDNKRE